jgi:hypothetical protein
VSPPDGARGDAIQITASGFAAGETVTASLVHEPGPKNLKQKKKGKQGKKSKGKKNQRGKDNQAIMTLGAASVAPAGTAALTFTVPAETPLGRHRLDVVGSEGTRASTSFAVLPGASRTAAERTSGASGAADASGESPSDGSNPSAPAGDGPEHVLLPPEERTLVTALPKRKPGKSGDRAGRDDNDNGNGKQKPKHKNKQARVGEHRPNRQRRRLSRQDSNDESP